MLNTAFGISVLVLVANIPLGFYRKKTNRFLAKIFYIHLHVPFIFALRQYFALDAIYIVPFALSAVVGQFIGGYYYYKRTQHK